MEHCKKGDFPWIQTTTLINEYWIEFIHANCQFRIIMRSKNRCGFCIWI